MFVPVCVGLGMRGYVCVCVCVCVQVTVPAVDYLPPDCVDLYVTNSGSHQPSYMFRLLSELYHPNDYNL